MKKFSTFLFLFLVSFLMIANSFSGTFIPEKEFVDKYGNKVIVQDGYLAQYDRHDILPDLDAWVFNQRKGTQFSSLLIYYQKEAEEEIQREVKVKDATGYYLSSHVTPGNWLIRVFALTPQGERGKELASFPYTVGPARTILIRFYLQ